GESHLSQLGDVASVAREKSALLAAAPGVRVSGAGAARRLPEAVLSRTHVALLLDDASGDRLPARPRGEVTGRLDEGTLRAFGRAFQLPWPGKAMAENALLALTTARLLGVEPERAFA